AAGGCVCAAAFPRRGSVAWRPWWWRRATPRPPPRSTNGVAKARNTPAGPNRTRASAGFARPIKSATAATTDNAPRAVSRKGLRVAAGRMTVLRTHSRKRSNRQSSAKFQKQTPGVGDAGRFEFSRASMGLWSARPQVAGRLLAALGHHIIADGLALDERAH